MGTVSSHETKKLCVAFATKNEDLWIMRSQVALLGQLQAVCVLQASVRAGDKSFSRQMVLTVPGMAERFPMGSKHPTRPEGAAAQLARLHRGAPARTGEASLHRSGAHTGSPNAACKAGPPGAAIPACVPVVPCRPLRTPTTCPPTGGSERRPHVMLIGVCYSA